MGKFGWNYPPGAKHDRNAPYNQPDRSHEHEWVPDDMDNPVIEDGAAIFQEKCQYAEGRYGQGWRCEETRSYRFEYSTLESPDGETWDLPTIQEWDQLNDGSEVAEKVIEIEEAFHTHGPGDTVGFDVDPDPDCGQVTISYDGWKLHFES